MQPRPSFIGRLGRWRARIRQRPGGVLLEPVLFGVAAIGLAILTNALFPEKGRPVAISVVSCDHTVAEPRPAAKPPGSASTTAPVASARLERKNLQRVAAARAFELFDDPRYELGLVVFVDARKDQDYREGHIPGAHQHDPYHPEKHFATVVRLCLEAELVIVYCGGGECEDSERAAIGLREVGVEADRLFVFAGGMSEWLAAGYPVETGERLSGVLRGSMP